MTEPTYPAWIEAAPEPKRTLYKIREEYLRRLWWMAGARSSVGDHADLEVAIAAVRKARAANHRVLALKRHLRKRV